MKNNIIVLAIVALLMSISCVEEYQLGDDFLEKPPATSDTNLDTIFSRKVYAEKLLWNAYSHMYAGLPLAWDARSAKMNMTAFEVLSDCWHSTMAWDGANRLYYTNAYNSTLESNNPHVKYSFIQESVWEGVRKAWIFIENVDRVPDMSSEDKARLKAEAKVIIASLYFDMFRHFGGLPIVDKVITDQDLMDKRPRATVIETNDFIVSLLNDAINTPELPWVLTATESSSWDGRHTQAGAMALKCKVLLFTASPLFNDNAPYCAESPQDAVAQHLVWTGGYKSELWDRVLDACKAFFDKNQEQGEVYKLIQAETADEKGYREAYRKGYYTRGSGNENPEMLISTRYSVHNWGGNYANFYFFFSTIYGAFGPTVEFMEMFPWSDGAAFDWNDDSKRNNLHSNRDPRLYENIAINMSSEWQGRRCQLWDGGKDKSDALLDLRFANGMGIYKFSLDFIRTSTANGSGAGLARGRIMMWPYLRMAEVHLIYAEALMKNGQYSKAIEELNKVRNRVGLKGLTEANPSRSFGSEADLLPEILRERACELGMEDVRFFDMIRYKMADRFKKQLHKLVTKRADGKDVPATITGGVYTYPTEFVYTKEPITTTTRLVWSEPERFSTKWYLSAFPQTELNKDYGLVQNPGW